MLGFFKYLFLIFFLIFISRVWIRIMEGFVELDPDGAHANPDSYYNTCGSTSLQLDTVCIRIRILMVLDSDLDPNPYETPS